MVAKSYQTFIQECEPYQLNNKAYVNVRNPKTGAVKAVRWYTEKEYAKMYPEAKISNESSTPWTKSQKEALGFDKGYITIFKGGADESQEWFLQSEARYARWWGWYFISTIEVPADVPAEAVRLPWELVGKEDGNLKTEAEVRAAIESLMYEESPSAYQGAIGDRIEVTVTVKKNLQLENGFGVTNMMIMVDSVGNEYVWTTSAKSWNPGETKTIRGTVKDHRTYKRKQQTVLTRCMEK